MLLMEDIYISYNIFDLHYTINSRKITRNNMKQSLFINIFSGALSLNKHYMFLSISVVTSGKYSGTVI